MAYTTTQAGGGLGTQVSITISTTVTPIYEIVEFTEDNIVMDYGNATNLNSPGFKETVPLIRDPGGMTITCNRVSTDPGQAGVYAAWIAQPQVPSTWTIVAPLEPGQSTTGDTKTSLGYVSEWEEFANVGADKILQTKFKVKFTGAPTYTEGS